MKKEVFFSEKQVLELVDKLTKEGKKVHWYKVRNRWYVEYKN